MSSLIVAIAAIDEVKPHPNADRLEIAVIKGWQVIVGKGTYQPGDRVIYVPPDAVVPEIWSDRWGVTKYLSKGRVRCAKLRGVPSFGFTAPITDLVLFHEANNVDVDVDENVADLFGITKYEPPFKASAEDAAPDHPLFVKYTDIENLRHFPDMLIPGEELVATEKIHGTNARVGMIEGELMAGSHRLRRKRPDDLSSSLYWYPLTLPSVAALLDDLGAVHKQVILFGEVFGRVQSLRYGLPNAVAFRAFDLMLDGQYADWDWFDATCHLYGVPIVPLVARGAMDLEQIKRLSEGHTLVPGGDHIREGVVVKPIRERHDGRTGRVILKMVSDAYLLSGKDEPVAEVEP